MKASQIRDMTLEEAERQLQDSQEELTNLKFQLVTKQLDNPLRIRQVRRDVARLTTIIHEHKLGIRKLASSSSESEPVVGEEG